MMYLILDHAHLTNTTDSNPQSLNMCGPGLENAVYLRDLADGRAIVHLNLDQGCVLLDAAEVEALVADCGGETYATVADVIAAYAGELDGYDTYNDPDNGETINVPRFTGVAE